MYQKDRELDARLSILEDQMAEYRETIQSRLSVLEVVVAVLREYVLASVKTGAVSKSVLDIAQLAAATEIRVGELKKEQDRKRGLEIVSGSALDADHPVVGKIEGIRQDINDKIAEIEKLYAQFRRKVK